MKPPFDIAADLDTPVSAFRKLAASGFEPSFLLESVEGGARLARYSFLGLGRAVTLTVSENTMTLNGEPRPTPAARDALLGALRDALDLAPALEPDAGGLPFTGGLVGATGYDAVRRFERLPSHAQADPDALWASYVAPRSVSSSTTSRAASRAPRGPEWERLLCARDHPRPARPSPPARATRAHALPHARRFCGASRQINATSDGDVFQPLPPLRGRAPLRPLRGLPRALALVHAYRPPRPPRGRCVVGSRPARQASGDVAASAITGTRRGRPTSPTSADSRHSEEAAEHVARRPRPQRPWPCRSPGRSVSILPRHRALQPRTHRVGVSSGRRGRGHVRPLRRRVPGRDALGARRSARWRSSALRRCGGALRDKEATSRNRRHGPGHLHPHDRVRRRQATHQAARASSRSNPTPARRGPLAQRSGGRSASPRRGVSARVLMIDMADSFTLTRATAGELGGRGHDRARRCHRRQATVFRRRVVSPAGPPLRRRHQHGRHQAFAGQRPS